RVRGIVDRVLRDFGLLPHRDRLEAENRADAQRFARLAELRMAGQRVVVVDAENRDPPQVGLPDGVRGGVEKGERLRRVDMRVDAPCGNVLAFDLAVLDELAKPLHSVDSSARLLAFPVAVLALV